jgi:hypothetical protein
MSDCVRLSALAFGVVVACLGCGSGTEEGARADAAAGDPDGSPDAAPACVPISPRAISTGLATAPPRIAAHEGGYGVVWGDPRDEGDAKSDDELYFGALDAAGERVGPDVRLTTAPGNLAGIAIARVGTGYAVAFNETREPAQLLATRLDADGQKLFDEVPLGPLGTPPGIAVSGDAVGVTWADADAVRFARLSDDGVVGEPVTVTSGNNPSIAPSGEDGWTVAYHSDRVYVSLLDAEGGGGDIALPVSDGPGLRAALTIGTGLFGVAWSTGAPDHDVMFAIFEATGARLVDEVQLTTGELVEGLPVTAKGGGFVVGWTTADEELVVMGIDGTGASSIPTILSTTAFHEAFRPLDIAFNGDSFAVVWLDTRDGEPRPYFATYCPF